MNNKNIVLIGISGTGKSTLSQRLALLTGLTLHHMDSIIWSENWVESTEEEIISSLDKIANSNGWIVEGWIDQYSKTILERANLILYLDYPGWLAMWGGIQRWWSYRGKKRPEMPNGCNESLDLKFLQTMFYRKERPHIEKILTQFNVRNVYRIMSRNELEMCLPKIVKEL